MNKQTRRMIDQHMEVLSQFSEDAEAIREAIGDMNDHEQEKLDNMPEGLRESERGEQMANSISQLEEALSNLEEISSLIDTTIENLEAAKE